MTWPLPRRDPAEEPAPTVNDPEDPSTWVISTDGIGPIELGMSFDEVTAITGGEVADSYPDNPDNRCEYVEGAAVTGLDGGIVVSGFDDTVVTIIWTSAGQERLDPEAPTPQTEDGVTLGMPNEDVEQIWGPVTHELWGPGGNAAWQLDDGANHLLALTTQTSRTAPDEATWVSHVLVFEDGDAEPAAGFPNCYD